MNKKLALGALFIFAVFVCAAFNMMVSAEKADNIASPDAAQASTTIVISQLYPGGGSSSATVTYKNDYVELLNISATNQSLDGLSLQYGSATGTIGTGSNTIFTLPTGVTLQPGQYYLIQLGAAGTGGADLPVLPDTSSTNLSLSATSGKVALTNTATALGCGSSATPCTLPDSRIVDLVAYGAATPAEGGTAANNGAALASNQQGVVRNGNGCTDTDNNNSDFAVVTNPVPRNTASPKTTCGTSGGTPTANLSVSSNSASEATPGTTVTVTVTLSSSVGTNQTVTLGTSGTATLGSDYTLAGGNLSGTTITIPANSTTGSTTFTVIDDTAVEGTENAILTISNPSSGITLGGTVSQTIAIADNDAAPATPGIVINEIYGGGGNTGAVYAFDFIELYNNSASNIDISGYSIQYSGATSGTYSACTIQSSDTIIEPGTYFLIQLGSNNASVGGALPVPNAVCTQNLSATAGKVALVSSATTLTGGTCPPTGATVVDFVGYGATANCSETSPAPAPSNSTSIQRATGGVDTNNNSADFTVLATPTPTRATTGLPPGIGRNVDFDGDNRSDYLITRTISGLKYWLDSSLTNAFTSVQWGVASDTETPADFDGDGKTDYAVWRGNDTNPDRSYFYIIQSNGNTFRAEQFGKSGDDPRVVADYDGDKKADVAVYRTAAGGQNYLFYRGSLTGGSGFTSIPFGSGTSTRPNVGDYDGDGKADACVQYDSGGGAGVFAVRSSQTGAIDYTPWGSTTDKLAPGDYDGDGKSDFAVVRDVGGQLTWYLLYRAGGGSGGGGIGFGVTGDVIVPGDYDGDNRQDIAVWRTGSQAYFYVRRSSDSTLQSAPWGTTGDYPAANWLVH